MRAQTKQQAQGKWDGIIAELVGEHAISRKHGPCPVCGGKDRFRYDNRTNNGDWFCNVCGSGDGFGLLTATLGISFKEAAAMVNRMVGGIDEKPFKQPSNDIGRRRKALNRLWGSAKSQKVATHYLGGRGLPLDVVREAKDIRGTDACWHSDHRKNYPAMLALIRNAAGDPISIHRTYLMGSGARDKRIMPPTEKITGATVRLGVPTDVLVLAEGIETALAASVVMKAPAWATISAHGLEAFDAVPDGVKRVYICADNDATFTGQAAAFVCAKRLQEKKRQFETWVVMSPVTNYDMLDHLNEKRWHAEFLFWPYLLPVQDERDEVGVCCE